MTRRDSLGERGVALIVVIWVVTGLFALFSIFGERLAAEISAVASDIGRAEAEELAQVGFQTAVQRLVSDDTEWDSPKDKWAGRYGGNLNGGTWSVEVADEGSKINLNSFGGAILRQLPKMDDDRLAALLDWRDIDDEVRPGGAEIGYYQSLTPRSEARNTRFEVPEELMLVKGFKEIYGGMQGLVTTWGPLNVAVMDPDAFEALLVARGVSKTTAQFIKRDLITRRGASPDSPPSLEAFRESLATFTQPDMEKVALDLTVDGTINVNTAQPEVLKVLWAGLGLPDDSLARLLEARKSTNFASAAQIAGALGDETASRKLTGYLSVHSRVFSLIVEGQSRGGQRVRGKAIVRRDRVADSDNAWEVHVLSWQWQGRGGTKNEASAPI